MDEALIGKVLPTMPPALHCRMPPWIWPGNLMPFCWVPLVEPNGSLWIFQYAPNVDLGLELLDCSR